MRGPAAGTFCLFCFGFRQNSRMNPSARPWLSSESSSRFSMNRSADSWSQCAPNLAGLSRTAPSERGRLPARLPPLMKLRAGCRAQSRRSWSQWRILRSWGLSMNLGRTRQVGLKVNEVWALEASEPGLAMALFVLVSAASGQCRCAGGQPLTGRAGGDHDNGGNEAGAYPVKWNATSNLL